MASVLVVEDNPDLAALMVQLLRICGISATAANSGAAALSAVRTVPPDLMILDVMMPGISGLDVLREMKADPDLAKLRVVMFTALDDPDVRQQAMELGAADYLVKGQLDATALEKVVRRHL